MSTGLVMGNAAPVTASSEKTSNYHEAPRFLKAPKFDQGKGNVKIVSRLAFKQLLIIIKKDIELE